MLRRDIRHSLRFPMMTARGMLVPVLLLLLFVGRVRARAAGHGLGALSAGGRVSYIDYLTPGILVMTAGFAAEATAVNVCTDMNEGIIARFRTMAISRTSVLTGQVAGSLIRTMISAAVVVGVALALGFRPSASPAEWLAAAGIFALLTLALTWLTVAFGLLAKTPAGANSLSLLPAFLPFVSSAFIPASRDDRRRALVRRPTSRSPPSSTPCAACWPAPGSAIAPSSRSPGARACRWPGTCGRGCCTTAAPRLLG